MRIYALLCITLLSSIPLLAQVEIGRLEHNPAYRQAKAAELQKIVTHPQCINRPQLNAWVSDFVAPDCDLANGSITLTVVFTEPSVSLAVTESGTNVATTNLTSDTYVLDNIGIGAYLFSMTTPSGLTQRVRFLLNSEDSNAAQLGEVFDFEAAFCGLGSVKNRTLPSPGALPSWDIFDLDGINVATITGFSQTVALEGGPYYGKSTTFGPCEVVKDLTVPEVISFELTDDNFFFDDFSDSNLFPKDILWEDDFAFVNRTFAFEPPSIGAATLDGLDETGRPYIPSADLAIGTADRLTARPFCMAGITEADSLYLSFYYQQQGLGDFPNSGDSLILEILDIRIDNAGTAHPGVWNPVWSEVGQNMSIPDAPFQLVLQPIVDDLIAEPEILEIVPNADNPEQMDTTVLGTASFFLPGFQFRWRSVATATGSNDHWNIDYVTLNKDRNFSDTGVTDVAHVGPAKDFLKNYTAMPWNQFVNYQDTELDTALSYVVRNNANDPTQIVNTLVTATELCSETELENIELDLFPITGLTTDTIQIGAGIGGSDLLLRSPLPNSFDEQNGIVIRTEAVLNNSDDLIAVNDTLIHDQVFSNFYAYDDGSAERVFKIQVPGTQFAYQFVLNEPDNIRGIGIAYNQITQSVDPASGTIRLTVWDDILRFDGSGETVVLYEQEVAFPIFTDQQQGFNYHYFTEETLVQDTIYIGFELLSPGEIQFGYDRNNNSIDKWYTRDGGFWESLVASPTFPTGSPMMRPIIGNGLPPVGIDDPVRNAFELFPNPSSGQLTIQLPHSNQGIEQYRIFDVSGRLLVDESFTQSQIDVSKLAAGVYFFEVLSEEGLFERKKFVKL